MKHCTIYSTAALCLLLIHAAAAISISTLSPIDDATAVPVDSNLVVSFDENLQPAIPFSATDTNVNGIENAVTGSTAQSFNGSVLTITNTGNTNYNGGIASQQDIDTLLSAPLAATDSILLTLTVDSITGNPSANGIEFGISPNNSGFRPANNLLFALKANAAASAMAGNALVSPGAAAGWSVTEASITDGLTMTLTADSSGFTFTFSDVVLASGTGPTTFSGTFASPAQFRNLFGTGFFYVTSQKAGGNMTVNISKATVQTQLTIRRAFDGSVVEAVPADAANVAIGGAALALTPSNHLEGGLQHYIGISTGAVENLAGTDFAGIGDASTWNFTTFGTELPLQEFTTAAKGSDTVGDDSPAEAGAFAGATLYVRERTTASQLALQVEAFLKFDLSGITATQVNSAYLNVHEFNKLNNVNTADLFLARVTNA